MEHFNNILLIIISVVIVVAIYFISLYYIILLKQNRTNLKPFVDMDFNWNVLTIIRDFISYY